MSSRPLTLRLLGDCIRGASFLQLMKECSDTIRTVARVPLRRRIRILFLSVRVPRLGNLRFSHVIDPRAEVVFAATFKRCTLSDCGIGTLSCLLGPVDCISFLRSIGGTIR